MSKKMQLSESDGHNDNYDLQLCGFRIGSDNYAIPVLDVQEVVKSHFVTKVPLSPPYIRGLINLRGQIVTAVNLHNLFQIEGDYSDTHMNIIVRNEESLYSLVVDEIHDVIDVQKERFEQTPESIDENLKKFIKGVYKLDDDLLILLSLEKILNFE